jgi:hypothetical protein
MDKTKHTPPPAVWVNLSWDLGVPHYVTGRQPTGPRDPQLGPYRYLLAERVERALEAMAKLVRLTKAQRAALARVAYRFDGVHPPLFAPDETHGTKELSLAIRRQLEAMLLIERFDRAAYVHATRPNEAVPPFIYFRPTAAGRIALGGSTFGVPS